MSFLTAEWRKLIFANYIIDPIVLNEYIPYGTELDLWEDHCYVSLVGFMFQNTKLQGIKIPFHVNFEEVNLRFYVKRKDNGEWKRGVVFIKEIVPKFAIATIANLFYKEHYVCLPMNHNINKDQDLLQVSYAWRMGNRQHSILVEARVKGQEIPLNSEEEFITEHYWGYAKISDRRTNEYEVRHPSWESYPVQGFEIDVDFGQVYGSQFQFLNELNPSSVMLAEGSQISVENRKRIQKIN